MTNQSIPAMHAPPHSYYPCLASPAFTQPHCEAQLVIAHSSLTIYFKSKPSRPASVQTRALSHQIWSGSTHTLLSVCREYWPANRSLRLSQKSGMPGCHDFQCKSACKCSKPTHSFPFQTINAHFALVLIQC